MESIMGGRESPTLGKEISSAIVRYPGSVYRRVYGEKNGQVIAQTCVKQLCEDPIMQEKFHFDPSIPLKRIGQGWNGATYTDGNIVIKIPYDRTPVDGFGLPQTQEGAEILQGHLQILKDTATRNGLDRLIDQNQEVVYLEPVAEVHEGKVAVVQAYYKNLTGLGHIEKFTRKQKNEIFRQFIHFIAFVNDLRRQGITPDLFGVENLAINYDNDLEDPYLILPDIGVADHSRSGRMTRFGLEAAFLKEVFLWFYEFVFDGAYTLPEDMPSRRDVA